MRYLIKNLLEEKCITEDKCVLIITKHLSNYGINYHFSDTRILEIDNTILPVQEFKLREELSRNGFKLKKNKKSKLIDDIKFNVQKLINSQDLLNFNLSYYLSDELGYNYTYLANIFSEEEGISIKKYIIEQKIEKVKAMILNERYSLKQIASLMRYKNVSHLTNQFKKAAGITPSCFRRNMCAK